MPILDFDLAVTLDDRACPGFPRRVRLACSQVLTFQNVITSTASYVNLLTGYANAADVAIGAVALRTNQSLLVAINDDVPDQPLTLPANNFCGWIRSAVEYDALAPLIKIKATVNPTTVVVIVGLL